MSAPTPNTTGLREAVEALHGRTHWCFRDEDGQEPLIYDRRCPCPTYAAAHPDPTPEPMPTGLPVPGAPTTAEQNAEHEAFHGTCPYCRHASHSTLGFCPNMASDNDCSCTHGTTPAPGPDAGDVKPNLEGLYAAVGYRSDTPERVLRWLAAHDAEVRSDTAERIAQTIKAEACEHRDFKFQGGLRLAARIAREEASRG